MPVVITGCTGWYDFTNPDRLYVTPLTQLDTVGAKVSADNDFITQCRSYDFGGTYEYFLQNSGASRPKYKTNVVNGESVARFTPISGSTPYTFAHHADRSTFDHSTQQDIQDAFSSTAKTAVIAFQSRDTGTSSSLGYGGKQLIDDSGINRFAISLRDASDPTRVLIRAFTYDGADKHVDISVFLNSWYIAAIKHDGTDLKLRINSGSWSSVAAGTTVSFTGGAVSIMEGDGNNIDVDVAHLVTFNTAVSDADIRLVEEYLSAQLAITL
jgi:hypothetical protein